MKHCLLAARFYRCPTAGRYLLAAAQVMPNANVTVQHAYAMHVYARQTNAGGWRYFTGSNDQPNVAAWQTIQLATLQQYLPYIKPCPTLIRACVMAWHLHQHNSAVRQAIGQYQFNVAKQQADNVVNWWQLAKGVPVPPAYKQQLFVTRKQRQRYYAAWCAANPSGTATANLVAPQYTITHLQLA